MVCVGGALAVPSCSRVLFGEEVANPGFQTDTGPPRDALDELLTDLAATGWQVSVGTTDAHIPREGGLVPDMDAWEASAWAEFTREDATADEIMELVRSMDAMFTARGWPARTIPHPDQCWGLDWTDPHGSSISAQMAPEDVSFSESSRIVLQVFSRSGGDPSDGPAAPATDESILGCFEDWVRARVP